jgi:hypothetical protein
VYLAISITFLVTLAFGLGGKTVSSQHWHGFQTVVAIVLAVTSIAAATWYALVGYAFQAWTETRTRSILTKARNTGKLPSWLKNVIESPTELEPWRVYEMIVYKACNLVFFATVLAAALTLGGIGLWW